jgi:hypothetical protein
MKLVKSLLIGTGSVVLAGFILTLLAPKALHAVVATLVLVANTSSNPAIVSDMDDPGRVAYLSSARFISGPAECNSEGCLLNFGPVPANHRLVVQHLSADLVFTSAPGQVSLEYFGAGMGIRGGLTSQATAAFHNASVAQYREAFELPVQFYVDAGQSFQTNMQAENLGGFLGGSVTASGYMLDCAAAPCAAIAH